MTTAAVSFTDVARREAHFSLHSVSFELPAGRALGLVGPNGAGKSTLLRLAMGLVLADRGEVRVFGHRVAPGLTEHRAHAAFVADELSLFASRSLAWHAPLVEDLCPHFDSATFVALTTRFGLPPTQPTGQFSRGQRMKALLALALARHPRLLLLDEPTAGLDPHSRLELLGLLKDEVRARGVTMIFASHLTQDLEQVADDLGLIEGGRLVALGPCAALLPTLAARHGAHHAS